MYFTEGQPEVGVWRAEGKICSVSEERIQPAEERAAPCESAERSSPTSAPTAPLDLCLPRGSGSPGQVLISNYLHFLLAPSFSPRDPTSTCPFTCLCCGTQQVVAESCSPLPDLGISAGGLQKACNSGAAFLLL